MPVHPIRILAFFVSLLICAAGLADSPPIAYGSPQTNLLQAKGLVSVDRTTFFDEGKYINLTDYENDIKLSDFTVSGGRMVALADGGSRLDPGRNINPYQAMQIPIEGIYGRTQSIPGFGFVCDKTAAAANGASVSIRYGYIGDMRDIADPSFNIPVSIEATYTIRDGKTIAEEGDYQESYTGHPVIHLPKCFSHGVFFCGTNVLDAHYEFFNAQTGAPIELGTIYLTATSLNRGEGFAVPSSNVTACYISNEAPAASTLYDRNGRKTAYGILAGSLLYDKTTEYDDGYTTFVGCPDIYDSRGNKIDFSDSIGEETFYWRSVCFSLDCRSANAIDAKVYSMKTASWSGTEGIAGDGEASNGSMWFATNFMTLTSVKPPAPTKTVDKSHDIKLGDTLTYRIAQQVNDLGATSFIRYESMSVIDALPNTLRFKSARLLDGNGQELGSAGTARFDDATRTVTFEFSRDFCESGMTMTGETYYLEIEAEVVDYPDDGTLTFGNSARVAINGLEQPSGEVVVELASPELTVEKHAMQNPPTADDYEFQVGDQIAYRAVINQTREQTRAKGLTVSDTLPEGLRLVFGSVEVTGAEGARLDEAESGWSLSLEDLDFDEPLEVSYRAAATDAGNGSEIVNTATAWAGNIAPGIPGSESTPAVDDTEVFINSPSLSVSEEASVSPLTESAFERRVGDPVVFTVTVENTATGTIAKGLSLTSLTLPEGLAIVDEPDAVTVEGIALGEDPMQVPYPIHGDDSLHGETEKRIIEGAAETADDRLGASLMLSYLPSNTPVRISFECLPEESVNGLEILNRAVVYAENATSPVQSDPATRVWINSPRLVIEKQAPPLAYQAGDTVSYRIDALNKVPGTVATDVVFEDAFETPGMELLRNSIVVADQDGAIITDETSIVQNIGSQDWKVETNSALVNPRNQRVWDCDEGGALIETTRQNPLNLERECSYRIEYQALITDSALAAQTATNSVTVTSNENLPATDEETVSISGPALGIGKTADRGFYRVGDIAEYTIETTSLRTGETAHNVRIGDDFSADHTRAATILEDSVSIRDERGRALAGWDIEWNDNTAGDHIGFAIATHTDLPDSSKLIVSYKVRFTAKTISKAVANTAWAEADDAPRAQTTCSITCADPDDTSLAIEKTSDSETYAPGHTAHYALRIGNTDEAEPARSVNVADMLGATASAQIAQGSVVVNDKIGNPVESANVVYKEDGEGSLIGFAVETDADLSTEDELEIRYETLIDESAEPGDTIQNTAVASAENTGDASADREVSVASIPIDSKNDSEPVYGYKTTAYKTANPASGSAVEAGSEIAYLITVKNTGATTAPTVRVRDYIPEKTAYIFDTATDGGAFVKASDERRSYVEWVLTDLEPEGERTVGFSVRIDDNASGWIVNTAPYSPTADQVTAGDPTLPDPERVTARVAHSVDAQTAFGPIVNVVKSATPAAGDTVQPGSEVAYMLAAANSGDEAAENVLVRDPIPQGASLVMGSVSPNGVFDEQNNQIEWLIPQLAPGAVTEMSFKVIVESSPSIGSLENQASFAADGAGQMGHPGTLENTSNIVEHPLPAAPSAGHPSPKTGDGAAMIAAGALAAIALGTLAIALVARSKRKEAALRMQRIEPDIAARPHRRKTHSPKRRRKDYLRWK